MSLNVSTLNCKLLSFALLCFYTVKSWLQSRMGNSSISVLLPLLHIHLGVTISHENIIRVDRFEKQKTEKGLCFVILHDIHF